MTFAYLYLSYQGMTGKGEEPGAEGFRNQGALPVPWSSGQRGAYRQDWFGYLEKGVRAKR